MANEKISSFSNGPDDDAHDGCRLRQRRPEKKMVIGLDDNFAPMGYRNEKNEIVGMDIDLAREACKRAGMEVEFKPIDWGAKEAELKSKRIDAIWNCFNR